MFVNHYSFHLCQSLSLPSHPSSTPFPSLLPSYLLSGPSPRPSSFPIASIPIPTSKLSILTRTAAIKPSTYSVVFLELMSYLTVLGFSPLSFLHYLNITNFFFVYVLQSDRT